MLPGRSCEVMCFISLVSLFLLIVSCFGKKPPEFLSHGDMSDFSLNENAPNGSVIYTLQAVNRDGGRVFYGIKSDSLSVNSLTGAVTLTRPLDRETQRTLNVSIGVTNELENSQYIWLEKEILVLDDNDNEPIFVNQPYIVDIPEDTPVGTVVPSNIVISDLDAGINSDISLSCDSILSPIVCQKFAVSTHRISEGKYEGKISVVQNVDFEESRILLMPLKAKDHGLVAKESVIIYVVIRVTDVQDSPPKFIGTPYFTSISEETPPDISVLIITVRDGDIGNPRPLNITIQEPGENYFKISNITRSGNGVHVVTISTTNKLLDREDPMMLKSDGIYEFQIIATEITNSTVNQVISRGETITILVTDVNDHIPKFSQREVQINVSEDAKSGLQLSGFDLTVYDKDLEENAEYKIAIQSDSEVGEIFEVGPEAGVKNTPVLISVKNGGRLDFENTEMRTILFEIVASDSLGRSSTAKIIVNVVDTNDNDPIFNQIKYVVEIQENSTPGTEIASLIATDKDEGTNGQVTYTLQGFGSELFDVDPVTGKLSVAACGKETCLNREDVDQYSLIFCARDGGGRLGTTNIIIEVIDTNDNSPIFQSKEIMGTLHSVSSEIRPPLIFHADDADSSSSGNNLVSYSIVEVDDDMLKGVFEIDAQSGGVRVAQNPKWDSTKGLPGTVSLKVRATDGGHPPLSTDAYAILTIDNSLHKPLVFTHSSYNATISETERDGAFVLQVAALELSAQSSLVYTILEGDFDNFVINSTSGVVSVAPMADLDLEVSPAAYKIKVMAASKSDSATATALLVISVEDVNNKPPSFTKKYYTAFVHENADVGDFVLHVVATDPDKNSLLRYSFAKTSVVRDSSGVIVKSIDAIHNTFKLDEETGVLRVAQPLDHSRAANFLIFLKVTDENAADKSINQTSFTEVSLYIQAERTPEPVFSGSWTPASPSLIYSIPEEPPLHSVLFTIIAKSPVGQPIKFYKVTNSDPLNYVSVSETSGIATLQRRLDYEEMSETKQVEFLVEAISEFNSNKYSSTATVFIDVKDINDNTPFFTQKTYHTTVIESATHPHTFLTVEANDKDADDNFKKIEYFLSGDGVDQFEIDPMTGEITVRENITLDRETKSRYILRAIAKDNPDGEGNRQEASAVVIVDVLDDNDNYPVFLQVLYQAVIPETIPVGFHVKLVTAVDADRNIQLHYSISPSSELNDFFSVNERTGEVKVKKPLSGKGRLEPYRVILEATDFVKSASVPMLVFIMDVPGNDAIPVFEKPALHERAAVVENTPVGTTIVFKVSAKDADETSETSQVRYSLLFNGPALEFQPFIIHPVTGAITTTAVLDREKCQNYTIVVIASDAGQPPQHAYRDLIIDVKDADDNKPFFDRAEHSMPTEMEVDEESKPGTVVGTIHAVDNDEGANAINHYRIADGNVDGAFTIKQRKDGVGELHVQGKLDFEKTREYVLTVKVEGPNAKQEPGKMVYDSFDKSMVQVRVLVRDVDDHRPVFLNGDATTGIRSNATKGTHVYNFIAKDEDSIASKIEFKLSDVKFYSAFTSESVDAKSVFALDETGVLKTRISLLEFDQGYFTVHVEAISGKFSTESTLDVHVLDERDLLKFVFNKALFEVQPQLQEFQTKLHNMIPSGPLPWKVNIYDSQFFGQDDDMNSSSVCFQFMNSDNTAFSQSETESLLDLSSQPKLGLLYHNFGVHSVQNCYGGGESYAMSWTEHFVLVIAGFMGALAMTSSFLLKHLFTRYKRNIRRRKQYRMVHQPLSRNGHGHNHNHTTMERQQRIHAWQLQHPSMANATMETSYA